MLTFNVTLVLCETSLLGDRIAIIATEDPGIAAIVGNTELSFRSSNEEINFSWNRDRVLYSSLTRDRVYDLRPDQRLMYMGCAFKTRRQATL